MKNLKHIQEFDTEMAWAQALAADLGHTLKRLLGEQEQVVLAVSGGKSPQPVFESLSRLHLDWQRVVIQLVDERMVTRAHPESNSLLVEQFLHQHQAAAAIWQNVLPQAKLDEASLNDAQRQQVLQDALKQYRVPDVVVLGMGEDAHTASLFPNALQLPQGLASNAPNLLLIEPPVATYWRLSMSMHAILQAPHIYIAAWGQTKRAVLQQAWAQKSDFMPISHVLHLAKGDQLHVYC